MLDCGISSLTSHQQAELSRAEATQPSKTRPHIPANNTGLINSLFVFDARPSGTISHPNNSHRQSSQQHHGGGYQQQT